MDSNQPKLTCLREYKLSRTTPDYFRDPSTITFQNVKNMSLENKAHSRNLGMKCCGVFSDTRTRNNLINKKFKGIFSDFNKIIL